MRDHLNKVGISQRGTNSSFSSSVLFALTSFSRRSSAWRSSSVLLVLISRSRWSSPWRSSSALFALVSFRRCSSSWPYSTILFALISPRRCSSSWSCCSELFLLHFLCLSLSLSLLWSLCSSVMIVPRPARVQPNKLNIELEIEIFLRNALKGHNIDNKGV